MKRHSIIEASTGAMSSVDPDGNAANSATAPPSSRLRLPFLRGSTIGITLALLLLVAGFAFVNFQSFVSMANFNNILISASLLIVMGVGATYVLISGGVDLSIGSVLVFSGVVAGAVMQRMGGQGISTSIVGVVVSIAGGAAWGLINGLAVTRLRVPPLIVTLGSMGAAMGLALVISHGNDYVDIPAEFVGTIGVGQIFGIPWLAVIAGAVALVGGVVLATTNFGQKTYAIGSNAEAAARCGINVDRHLVSIYTIAGMLAGLAGIMSFAQFGSTTIAGHESDTLNVIAAVIIGGTSLFGGSGTIFGTVIGTLIPAVLANGLVIGGLNSFWRDFVVGVVLVMAVYFDQVRRRRRNSV